MTNDTLLRSSQVEAKVGLSRATIYRQEKKGQFPRRRQISAGCVGWSEHELNQWIKLGPEQWYASQNIPVD